MAIQVQDDFSKRGCSFRHFHTDAWWEVEASRGVFEVWFTVHVRIAPSNCLSPLPRPYTAERHERPSNHLPIHSSRKFHLPHHPHSLKWKRVGGLFTVRGQFPPSLRLMSLHSWCPFPLASSVHLFVRQRPSGDPTNCLLIGAPAFTDIFVPVTRRCDPQPTQLWWSAIRAARLPRCHVLAFGDRHRRILEQTWPRLRWFQVGHGSLPSVCSKFEK